MRALLWNVLNCSGFGNLIAFFFLSTCPGWGFSIQFSKIVCWDFLGIDQSTKGCQMVNRCAALNLHQKLSSLYRRIKSEYVSTLKNILYILHIHHSSCKISRKNSPMVLNEYIFCSLFKVGACV